MPDQTHIPLVGRDGRLGWVNLKEQPADSKEAIVHLENGTEMRIPADLLIFQPDGTCAIPFSKEQMSSVRQHPQGKKETVIVIPVLAEELAITKQEVTKGRVKISKQVHEREEVVDVPILQQEVEVQRIPVDRLVDKAPEVRYEGDTMIIRVMEEVLVVEKRLRLKEEVRITRVQKEVHEQKQVTLKEEGIEVNRIDAVDTNRIDEVDVKQIEVDQYKEKGD